MEDDSCDGLNRIQQAASLSLYHSILTERCCLCI
uniref:Uncharacterized protein n=1 Tax=Arundo donax TaxID=35708 RepID=A0A0A9EW87_ARUDO